MLYFQLCSCCFRGRLDKTSSGLLTLKKFLGALSQYNKLFRSWFICYFNALRGFEEVHLVNVISKVMYFTITDSVMQVIYID